MSVSAPLVSRLRGCQSLPSPPGIVLSLLKLTDDSSVPSRRFADLIEKDPALAAQILRIVNSPIYSLRREITSLRHAVTHVGVQGIRMLALGFALSRGLFGAASDAALINSFRKRSVLAAAMARELAGLVARDLEEEVFLGSLIQDVGILALREALGEPYERLLQATLEDHDHLVREEWRILGTDHAEVGAWLLEHWGLPEVLQGLVACSHGNAADRWGPAGLCVALSGLLSEVWTHRDIAAKILDHRSRTAEGLGISEAEVDRAMKRTASRIPELVELFNLEDGTDDFESMLYRAQQTAFDVGLQGMAQIRQREKVLEALSEEIDALKTKSRTDRLTGVFNRAFLEEALELAFQEAVADDADCGVCFCDVDNFKAVNDRLGHAAGDRLLRSLAQTLKRNLRQGDCVGRFGGDEFLLVLRGCPEARVSDVCHRIQEQVSRELESLIADPAIPCSISIGYAIQSGAYPYSTAGQWLEAADQSLYEAKRLGKNLVIGSLLAPN